MAKFPRNNLDKFPTFFPACSTPLGKTTHSERLQMTIELCHYELKKSLEVKGALGNILNFIFG